MPVSGLHVSHIVLRHGVGSGIPGRAVKPHLFLEDVRASAWFVGKVKGVVLRTVDGRG